MCMYECMYNIYMYIYMYICTGRTRRRTNSSAWKKRYVKRVGPILKECLEKRRKGQPRCTTSRFSFLSFTNFAFFHQLDWLDFLRFERPFLHAASSPNAIGYDENFDARKVYLWISIAAKHDGKLDRKSRHSSAPHRHKSDSFQLWSSDNFFLTRSLSFFPITHSLSLSDRWKQRW